MEISPVFRVHPSEDLLEAYAFNRLSGAALDFVDDHVFTCEKCLEAVGAEIDYIRTFKRGAADHLAAKEKSPRENHSSAGSSLPFRIPRSPSGWIGASLIATLCLFGIVSRPLPSSPPAAAVALSSFRGGTLTNQGPSLRPLDFVIQAADVPAMPEYRVLVVSQSGSAVWSGTSKPVDRKVTAHLKDGLPGGSYWVRLYDQRSELLTEFGLRIE